MHACPIAHIGTDVPIHARTLASCFMALVFIKNMIIIADLSREILYKEYIACLSE